jgi:hypothetical protein
MHGKKARLLACSDTHHSDAVGGKNVSNVFLLGVTIVIPRTPILIKVSRLCVSFYAIFTYDDAVIAVTGGWHCLIPVVCFKHRSNGL